MNNATKGLLLSGLVFPGLGQIVFEQYARGAVIVLAILSSIVVVAVEAEKRALLTLDKLEAEGGLMAMNDIIRIATEATANSGSLVPGYLLVGMVVVWIGGAADAWLIGRKMDQVT